MTLFRKTLLFPAAACALLGVAACSDGNPEPVDIPAPRQAPEPGPVTPPITPLADAPPEIQADGVDLPARSIEPLDPDAPPPGSPPPVLPETPPT
jgi:hypothetical protein